MYFQKWGLMLLPFLCFFRCSSDEDIPGSPPVADAGDDIEVPLDLAGTIALSGSGSSDPDGDQLTYQWTLNSQPDGSSATLNNDEEMNASITPDREGMYEITLSVDDGNHPPVQDNVSINVLPPTGGPPVANAGENQTVQVNTTVTLDGSASSDPDGDELTYEWISNTTPIDVEVTLENADEAVATFVAGATGLYSFRLEVTDPSGKSDTDNIDITVNQ